MIWIKILTILGCGALNAWGGYSWHNARRYLMPILIAATASLTIWKKKAKDWWEGLLLLPVMITLSLGYKNFGGGNFARACWLFLQAVVIGLGLTITHHIEWYWYIGYILGAGILGGIYKNWQQILGDAIAGCYLGSIVLVIH